MNLLRKIMGDPVDADSVCADTGFSRATHYRRMAKIGEKVK